MADTPEKPKTPFEIAGLEIDRQKAELYRPASILRTTEWGLLTVGSLLAALAFPPYFIAVLGSAFFSASGMLWVTHLSEAGRKRLKDFEREFSTGHQKEEAGDFKAAAEYYATLIPRYQDSPRIADIAVRRIELLKQKHPALFKKAPVKNKKGKRGRR